MKRKGIVAAGHRDTAGAAAQILEAGGNAFDAALAGMCAACVAEPVLCSLGGGGYLLACAFGGDHHLYDFFAQTPKSIRPPHETDFYAALADFGSERQEFHIGLGSVAVPGVVQGLFDVHKELGSLPMRDVVAPAVELARDGVVVGERQAYILSVVRAIYLATPGARGLYASARDPQRTLQAGEVLRMPDFAAVLDALSREGPDLFYRGEIAQRVAQDCHDFGGHLIRADLEDYAVECRRPLELDYRDRRIVTNPPPSSGGALVAFALNLLSSVNLAADGAGFEDRLALLAEVMDRTNKARAAHVAPTLEGGAAGILDAAVVEGFRLDLAAAPLCRRGTTHLNVIDAQGNAAALSLSNGEGAAYIVPGTGIMMNNMLGEEDINLQGFHAWPTDQRMASMMAPTMLLDRAGGIHALGSGGSNRLRTAILQVLVRLIDFGTDVDTAVEGPRIHVENGIVHVEAGFGSAAVAALEAGPWSIKRWPEANMYFGGVHTAYARPSAEDFRGAGDPRRDGAWAVV